ncbi:hypothetical protein ACFVUS_00750 [Nocardia sp. NPDC058058]|uniref:hypothetical protein n=1 Tax=Nocardia sp. NPDC058058 TaxID=3346317 RepID=UPI0036DE2113
MATLIDENIEEKTTEPAATGARPARTIAVPLSTMITAAVLATLVIIAGVFAALWISARGDLSDNTATAAANEHAEQVATDYAVGAATIDYKDVNSWFAKLKANTTPVLANKFDATAPKLQEILVPLKWTSTASPIAAKVASNSGGIYKVNVFVNVNSTSAQSPDGGLTTVTYSVTIDTNSGWKISDVGGMDGALPRK